MKKVEIEIPDGKIADVIEDGDKIVVTFKEISLLDRLKTIKDVLNYIIELSEDGVDWAEDLYNEYNNTEEDSYLEKLTLYRWLRLCIKLLQYLTDEHSIPLSFSHSTTTTLSANAICKRVLAISVLE